MDAIIATDVWNGIKLFKQKLDGKVIGYSSETVFCVQVGKGKKGGYKQSWSFKGQLHKALHYYNSINIGNGYKKRLVMCGRVLCKAAS